MYKSFLAGDFIRKNRSVLAGIIFIGLLQNCVTFLIPVSIGEFFTLQFQASSSKGRLLQLLGIHLPSLKSFFLLFTILLIVKAITSQAEQWLSLKEGERFVKIIRERLFATQLNQDISVFQRKAYGNYLLRYSNDLKAVKNYLLKGRLQVVKSSLFLFVGFVLLGLIHFRLTIYLVLLFAVLLTGIFFLARYQKKFIQQSRNKRSNLLAFVTKSFSRYNRIKEENNEPSFVRRFDEKSGQLYDANMKNNIIESIQQSLVPVLQYAMLGFILFLSITVKPSINHGDALVFVLVTLMLLSSMRQILKVPAILNKGNISLQKIEELLLQKNSGNKIIPAEESVRIEE